MELWNDLASVIVSRDFGEEVTKVFSGFIHNPWLTKNSFTNKLRIPSKIVDKSLAILIQQRLLSWNNNNSNELVFATTEENIKNAITRLAWPLFLQKVSKSFSFTYPTDQQGKSKAVVMLRMFLYHGQITSTQAKRLAARDVRDSQINDKVSDPEMSKIFFEEDDDEEDVLEKWEEIVQWLRSQEYIKPILKSKSEIDENTVFYVNYPIFVSLLRADLLIKLTRDLYGPFASRQISEIFKLTNGGRLFSTTELTNETAVEDLKLLELESLIRAQDNSRYLVDLPRLNRELFNEIVYLTVEQKTSKDGLRLFRIIQKHNKAEEETILSESMLEPITARRIIHTLLEQAFIDHKEISKPPRVFRKRQRVIQNLTIYGINIQKLVKTVQEQLLKTTLNIQTKLRLETQQIQDTLKRGQKLAEDDNDGIRDKMSANAFYELRDRLELSTFEIISTLLVFSLISEEIFDDEWARRQI